MEAPPPVALEALRQLYDDLGEELRALALHCSACGDCCRFEEADHVLCASELELALLKALPTQDRPVPAGRCPHHVENRCEARDARVLGCRLHFCQTSPEQRQRLEELSIAFHERLVQLHQAHGVPYAYGPAFTPSP